MTRGQDGSLDLSCVTLAFTTPRRFIPAHQKNADFPSTGRVDTLASGRKELRGTAFQDGDIPGGRSPQFIQSDEPSGLWCGEPLRPLRAVFWRPLRLKTLQQPETVERRVVTGIRTQPGRAKSRA